MSVHPDSQPWRVIIAGSRILEVTPDQAVSAIMLMPSFGA